MLSVGFVLPSGFQTMAIAAASAFELANATEGARLYDLHMLSEQGGLVSSSLGMAMQTAPLAQQPLDTLIVAGLLEPAPSTGTLIELIRQGATRTRRTASVCTGAFILGETGLLDGRRATTHWFHARALKQRFPAAQVEEDRIFITDGPIWTSAGMSAGLDLALGMIENDFGAELSRAVARKLVVYHRRGGG